MFDRITPVVKNLLIVNIAIFFISTLLSQNYVLGTYAFFNPFLPGSENLINPNFKIWQPLSYMFLHGGFHHLLSNMFGLFIFGSSLEYYMGPKKFLQYYIITGVGAALINTGINYYEMSNLMVDSELYMDMARTPMVGASGAIFGILVAYGYLFPNVEMMLLFFPFPIKAKYFVTLYGLYELFQGASGVQSGIAHFAHVGGLITGFILLYFFNFKRQNFR